LLTKPRIPSEEAPPARVAHQAPVAYPPPAATMDHADDERYVHAVGPLPLVTDPSTWGPAWAREESRPGIARCAAHEVFRGVDPQNPANPFSKQIQAMPHARLPSLDDQCRSITVVRRGR